MAGTEVLRDAILDSGIVLERDGEHSEFVGGMHGQKLDFDVIPSDSELYDLWVTTAAGYIDDEFEQLPEIVLGVANGTNRVALSIAQCFRGRMIGLESVKDEQNSKRLYLGEYAGELIASKNPSLVVVFEDSSTTGSQAVQVAKAAYEAGAQNVAVATTWKRRAALEKLDEAGVPYKAMIDEPLPTFTARDCKTSGFCARNWLFKPREGAPYLPLTRDF